MSSDSKVRQVALEVEKHQENVYTIRDILDPVNLFMVFANIVVYMVLSTWFYWAVVSKTPENEIIEKTALITDYASKSEEAQKSLEAYLSSDYNVRQVPSKAKEQEVQRSEVNFTLMKRFILPLVVAASAALFLMMVAMWRRGEKPNRVDLVLLLLVFVSFATEIIFYYTITDGISYISDAEFVDALL